MKDKTCGECKRHCIDCIIVAKAKACEDFEPKVITNGNRIRQMSNEEIAEMLVYPTKPMNINGNIYYEFTSCFLLGKSYPMREQAVFLTVRWLNAPAESEGKDE